MAVLSNAPGPIYVTVSGIFISESFEQSLNALYPMLLRPSGRATLLRAVQPANARSSISVTLCGTVMLSSDVQPENA